MSEEKKTVELKDEELEKVSGGLIPSGNCEWGYGKDNQPNGWFDAGTIVEDSSGVRLQIIGLESTQYNYGVETKWFNALVIYVPESAMCYTSWRENEVHTVNSSMVHIV